MKNIILISSIIIFLLSCSVNAQQKNNALYLSQSTPGEMTPGQTYGISVSMKNTGRTTWKTGAYSLKLIDVNESYLKTWGVSSVDVNSTVRPGEEIVFNFTLTAPLKEGEYQLQWQMAEGNAYFGEPTIAAPVRVSGPLNSSVQNNLSNSAVFVAQSIPTQMEQGQVYDLSITVKNNGSATWNPNDYKLRVIKNQASSANSDEAGWSIPDVILPYDVVPGSQAVFIFKVTAPSSTGTYEFQCRLVKNDTPFGEPSSVVNINVN